jgi:hypothetical protein
MCGANSGFLFGLIPGILKKSQDETKDAAKFAMNTQAAKQDKLLADAKAQQDQSMATEKGNAARDLARKKQLQAASAAQGRSGTILTSPLGLTDEPNGQKKTILGV